MIDAASSGVEGAEAEISFVAGQSIHSLQALRRQLTATARDLEIFQGANGLTGPADPPPLSLGSDSYFGDFCDN